MLSIAQQKAQRAGLDDVIEYAKGDCLALDFSDGEFDAVTVAYGVRNFEHLEQGYAEMHRVLRQGGTLCVIELSTPRNPLVLWFIGSIRAGLSRCSDAASRRMPVPIPICRRA